MKYGLGIKIFVSFLVGGIAILYKYRLNPRNNQSELSSIVKVPRPFLFNLIADTSNVPKYFSWVSELYEVDTRKNVSIGKQYRGKVNMPFLGTYDIHYKISEVKHGQWIIMKPEPLSGSYLNAELICMVNTITNAETQYYLKIVYHRPSALFQLTIGPLLKYLTDQQLIETHKRVEEMATQKWKEWQSTSITKARTGSSATTTEKPQISISTTTTTPSSKKPIPK